MCAAVFHQWLHEYCLLKRCLWLVAASSWPNDISSAADNAIFKNRAQNIECKFGYVARSADLLKPNVANILLFNFCVQKFVQHGPITIVINCNGLSLLIFVDKWPNYIYGSKSSPFQCMRAGFLCPNATFYIPAKIKMRFIRKYDFFCQNRHLL